MKLTRVTHAAHFDGEVAHQEDNSGEGLIPNSVFDVSLPSKQGTADPHTVEAGQKVSIGF